MTELIAYNGYDIVARARGQQVLYYERFGSYQGEWIVTSRDEESYYIYKDSFGSCSGCDALEGADLPRTFELGDSQVETFLKDYPPFVVIPIATMVTLVKKGTLEQVFPANLRADYSDIDYDRVVEQTSLLCKSYEGFITAPEILDIHNIEYRREAIERYGEERFMHDVGGVWVDTEGEHILVRVDREKEDFVFVNVKDSSTPRHYLLRVPPTTRTVREGIAWTFHLKPEEYVLTQET